MSTEPIPTPLNVIQGQALAMAITIVGGVARYSTGINLYGQIRKAQHSDAELIFTLTDKLTSSDVGADKRILLSLTGAHTRLIKDGAYDIFAAEPGAAQANALRVAFGPVLVVGSVSGAPT